MGQLPYNALESGLIFSDLLSLGIVEKLNHYTKM